MQNLPFPAQTTVISLPTGPLRLLRPANPAAVIDAVSELDADEKLPYWAELWPSAMGMAMALDGGEIPVAGRDVTELGCGLGLCALAAARAGARRVLASDWYTECLAFTQASAGENGLALETRVMDWRDPPADASADVVRAADVLYERRNATDVAAALDRLVRPGGEAWVADPGRTYLVNLRAAMESKVGFRLVERTMQVVSPLVPQGRAEIHLLRFSRAD